MTTFQHFALLEDPRSDHTKHYSLASLIFLTISAVVANCKHFTEIAAFAEERLK
ncbi:MAG: transposase family protein [Flavobacteriales bacterium]|nr:transposase family protein [Flavobacteriales bacterium]